MGTPCDPFIKISFDRAFDPHQARSNSEVVARNSSGEILASLGLRFGLEFVMIEGDSLTTIKKAKSVSKDISNIGAILQTFKTSLEKGEDIYLIGGVPDYVRWTDETTGPGLIWKGESFLESERKGFFRIAYEILRGPLHRWDKKDFTLAGRVPVGGPEGIAKKATTINISSPHMSQALIYKM
ncbi:hypothetical protein Goshw_000576 [Gossypium schwendimanii]|uniref:RNase H type-1 domain-containing protein n=1 Tax=Gossypium schwendimanii TaxID=34291 RepID=A0A7J9L7F1_GOSSC|nr:hypothetical protein [Gossypium schwendimanii]